jgi:hypothetical protein
MNISKKIISSVVTEMIESAQDLGEIVIIPNTYDVYIHTEDFKDLRHFLNVLREEIIKQLDREVQKRSKSNSAEVNKFVSVLNKLLGFSAFASGKEYQRVQEHWDINFQECNGKIRIEDKVFELRKGEVCTIRSFSSLDGQNLDSQFGTLVTVYQNDDSVKKSLIKPDEVSDLKTNRMSVVSGSTNTSYFALLKYKHKDIDEFQTYYMVKDRIIVGRQTDDEQVDLSLVNVSERVSPKHLEISIDRGSGKFFLKNMGIFGTTVNGVKIPDSRSKADVGAEGMNNKFEVPDKCRISLAGGEVIIDFSIA